MAWIPPTAADFKARFPAFAEIADATVDVFLSEAVGEVNDSWIESDRTPGVLHLTAHLMASEGLGVFGAGGAGAAVTGAIKWRKVGDVEVEFTGTSAQAGGNAGTYGATTYGQRYLELKRRNFPAVAVV